MNTQLLAHTPADERAWRTTARGGLLTFGLLLLPLSFLGYWFLDATQARLPLNLPTLPLMLVPAVAAVATRMLRREGFADVSFHLGGRRSLGALGLGLGLLLLVGALAYGAAYLGGLARLAPPDLPMLPSAGPLLHLVALLLLFLPIVALCSSRPSARSRDGETSPSRGSRAAMGPWAPASSSDPWALAPAGPRHAAARCPDGGRLGAETD